MKTTTFQANFCVPDIHGQQVYSITNSRDSAKIVCVFLLFGPCGAPWTHQVCARPLKQLMKALPASSTAQQRSFVPGFLNCGPAVILISTADWRRSISFTSSPALSCNIIQGAWLQKIHEGHITHQDKLECQWSSVLQEPPRLMKLARCLRFL